MEGRSTKDLVGDRVSGVRLGVSTWALSLHGSSSLVNKGYLELAIGVPRWNVYILSVYLEVLENGSMACLDVVTPFKYSVICAWCFQICTL